MRQRAEWQLPKGVSRGTWDYVIEPAIAGDYDRFHGEQPLMKLDSDWVAEELNRRTQAGRSPESILTADFGCGTARIARRFLSQGFRFLNVDLSSHMLQEASRACEPSTRSGQVRSNLVELDWLKASSIDIGLCLFSSIGMIRGRTNRRAFLKHLHRVLKPDGCGLVHVHNRYQSWLDPAGPWWLISTFLRSLVDRKCEFGDRIYAYRGLPKMFLHIYSRGELQRDLRVAGFENIEILRLDHRSAAVLPDRGGIFSPLRTGGYMAVCRK